jgi:hypothetical protein
VDGAAGYNPAQRIEASLDPAAAEGNYNKNIWTMVTNRCAGYQNTLSLGAPVRWGH